MLNNKALVNSFVCNQEARILFVIVVNDVVWAIRAINWVILFFVWPIRWNFVILKDISYKWIANNYEANQNLFNFEYRINVSVPIAVTCIVCKVDPRTIMSFFICISHIQTPFWGYYVNRVLFTSPMVKYFY